MCKCWFGHDKGGRWPVCHLGPLCNERQHKRSHWESDNCNSDQELASSMMRMMRWRCEECCIHICFFIPSCDAPLISWCFISTSYASQPVFLASRTSQDLDEKQWEKCDIFWDKVIVPWNFQIILIKPSSIWCWISTNLGKTGMKIGCVYPSKWKCAWWLISFLELTDVRFECLNE